MDIKNLILKNKRIAICLVVSLGIGIASGSTNMTKADYNNLVVQNEQLENRIVELDKLLEVNKKEVSELQEKKEEADRIAKEEAERKAEAERLAKEEAERKAEEEAERLAQQQQSSSNYVSSVGSGGSTQQETPIGTTVWLSESGSKYHSINNCGKMNPSKARQVTLESALSQGYTACTKCN